MPSSTKTTRKKAADQPRGIVKATVASRGGGRKSESKHECDAPKRTLFVTVKSGVAMWVLTKGFQKKADTLRAAIADLHVKDCGAWPKHPHLGISQVAISTEQYVVLRDTMYPDIEDIKKRYKRFQQLLCEFGIRARRKKKVFRLSFDMQGWINNGYRLVSEGRNRGGRSNTSIVFAHVTK